MRRLCRAFVLIDAGREVHCTHPADHGPAEDIHQGLLRVTLPDGSEQAASLVWSSSPSDWDAENRQRAE